MKKEIKKEEKLAEIFTDTPQESKVEVFDSLGMIEQMVEGLKSDQPAIVISSAAALKRVCFEATLMCDEAICLSVQNLGDRRLWERK